MVNATVDNETISIQLQSGESTTVPTGQVWKCYVTANGVNNVDDSFTRTTGLLVNGVNTVMASPDTDGEPTDHAEMVFTGGDTLKCESTDDDNDGVNISGFVVKS